MEPPSIYKLFGLFTLVFLALVRAEVEIELMKENLFDLKKTVLSNVNITAFGGTADEPDLHGTIGELVSFSPLDACEPLRPSKYTKVDEEGDLVFSKVSNLANVIVLISRGGCPFNQKFVNAARVKGVAGVLIFNSEGEDMPNEKIFLTSQNIDIPGYMVGNSVGVELMRKLSKYRGPSGAEGDSFSQADVKGSDTSSTPYVQIKLLPYKDKDTDRLNKIIQITLLIIIAVLAMAFALSIIVHLRSFQARQNANEGDENDSKDRLAPIDVEFLQKLPLKTFRGGKRKSAASSTSSAGAGKSNPKSPNANMFAVNGGIMSPTALTSPTGGLGSVLKQSSPINSAAITRNNSISKSSEYFEMINHNWPTNESCPICLDEFNFGEVLNELPCGHCYHIACIQPWLQYRSPQCPLCKLDVREEYRPNILDAKLASLSPIYQPTPTSFSMQRGSQSLETSAAEEHQSRLRKIWRKLTVRSPSPST